MAEKKQPYSPDIELLLSECQPDSVLLIGEEAGDAVDSYAAQKQVLGRDCEIHRRGVPPALEQIEQRYDMGIVAGALERMSKGEAMLMLSRLRDLYTRRFCAAVPVGANPGAQSEWKRNELLGFGMTLMNSFESEGRSVHLYTYDIATYKPTPGWLNPEDWANPEMWDKYRW